MKSCTREPSARPLIGVACAVCQLKRTPKRVGVTTPTTIGARSYSILPLAPPLFWSHASLLLVCYYTKAATNVLSILLSHSDSQSWHHQTPENSNHLLGEKILFRNLLAHPDHLSPPVPLNTAPQTPKAGMTKKNKKNTALGSL